MTQNLSRDRVVKRALSGFSAEGGELTAYFSSDTLRKIDARIYGETGRAHEEYFFRAGEAYLVLDTEDRYTHLPSRNVTRTTRTRTSFNGDRLIEWIDSKGQKRAPASKEADDLARAVLWMAHAFVECAYRKGSVDTCEAPPPPQRD